MKKSFRNVLGLIAFSFFSLAHAGFNEGMDSYTHGDYPSALKEFQSLADSGNRYAQFNLGVMYALGQGVQKDEKTAVALYRKAAEQGLAMAQFNLGQAYEEAAGVSLDEALALNWYRKAAEQDYPRAQFNLGLMYARGEGVKPDLVQAYKWFHLAALGGAPYAERNRDNAEKHMTAKQIDQAMALARSWVPKNM
ncbi:MAG: tetratricopeptide repeat protein [Formivibrio sp.]|nr:tetratricopeptide repeat protein [Formivibrio sp.]